MAGTMKVKLTDLNDWIEAERAGHLWIGSTAKGRAMCDQTPNSDGDTESQTVGCRHSNPDICRNHSTPNKCAFVRLDGQCLLPPQTWKGLFRQLQQQSS